MRVIVTDEGPGIPPDDLPHIFDSFYRARREDRTVPGTGLGLAIARGLIESMGGTITARSPRPDAPRDGAPGTLIEITLPAARPSASVRVDPPTRLSAIAEPNLSAPPNRSVQPDLSAKPGPA